MFRGQYEHAIDDKGRLSIPAKLREALGKDKTLVLTSFDAYITAFPMRAWRTIEERIRANPTFKRDMRDFLRLVYSSAEDAEIDSQGRSRSPQPLRPRGGVT